MHAAAIKLKSLGIDDLVRDLELSELGNHIAATLRDLTGRKRKDVPGEMTQGSRKLPRLTASSLPSPSHALAAQPGQSATAPQSLAAIMDGNNNPTLEMEYSVDPHPFGQPTGVDICRSIAENHAVPYNDPFNNSSMTLLRPQFCTLTENSGFEPIHLLGAISQSRL
ncbi:hypothetical protein DL766_000303 [Monosporascus sp. MC13-8B]|uniref:Uncharacterized protein n=1 Tax=Monosporascus cannonballus TaxID=155416 RepID=A0ABY0H1P0_9PEZI|nr:hypothetical protein DL762_006567 [Monosporascus cannonballus]RYP39641.1 hypothetical protein DL766_000303 [Monosporascus sp. MC13-8B]